MTNKRNMAVRLLAVVMAAVMAVTGLSIAVAAQEPCVEHSWSQGVVTTAPTCKTEGVKTFTCTVCGATTTEVMPVDQNAHSWDDGVVTRAATCKTTGVKVYTCAACGQKKGEIIPVDENAHVWVDEYNGDRTFFQNGTTTKCCDLCGAKGETKRIKLDWFVVVKNCLSVFNDTCVGKKLDFSSKFIAKTFETEGLSILNTMIIWTLGVVLFAGRVAFEPIRLVINQFYHIEK